MINPGVYPLTVNCGATYDKTFTADDGSGHINWTGYTAALKIREHLNSTPVLSLTSGSGITLGGTAGTIQIVITAAQSADIAPGTYIYDLELTSGAYVVRLLQGKITFVGNVTR